MTSHYYRPEDALVDHVCKLVAKSTRCGDGDNALRHAMLAQAVDAEEHHIQVDDMLREDVEQAETVEGEA